MKICRRILWLILYYAILGPTLAWGRAGGSGGGHSSGGGYSSHVSYGNGGGSSGSSGDPVTVIFFFVVIFFVLYGLVKKQRQQQISLAAAQMSKSPLTPEQQDDLKKKVQTAFLTIQTAWSEQNLKSMRRFITDGVYQRFNAQFKMMKILEQVNTLSNVKIKDIFLIKYFAEGNYECVDVKIHAYAVDQFSSKKFPQFNSPGNGEDFVECWSFIRRKDYMQGKDIFNSENCPSCSAPLNDKLLETARCSYCGAYLNGGEFDWVLCEITQEEDYQATTMTPALQEKITQVRPAYPAFSRHVLEDIGSNAFLQVLIAKYTGAADVLHRFCTDSAFATVKQYVQGTALVYDRLYLSSVEVTDLTLQDHAIHAQVQIEYCSLLVAFDDKGNARLLTNDIVKNQATVSLMRELSNETSKGSIFANACSKCGATQDDNLSAVCAYCASPLNDPKRDWVVEDFSCADLSQ